MQTPSIISLFADNNLP